jgi:hypothetical protein
MESLGSEKFSFLFVRLEPGLVMFFNTFVALRYPCRIYLFFEIESVHSSMFLLFFLNVDSQEDVSYRWVNRSINSED